MQSIKVEAKESSVAGHQNADKNDCVSLRARVMQGDAQAAEQLALDALERDRRGEPLTDEWNLASAALIAVQRPRMWSHGGGDEQSEITVGGHIYKATVSPTDVRRVVVEAAASRIHLQRPASVLHFFEDAQATGGFAGLVAVAMRANKKGAWSLWCGAYNAALVEAHHEELKRVMRGRDRKEPERTAWTRHATPLGINSCAVDVIEIATRKGVAAGNLTVEFTVAAMRAEIAAMQAAQAKYSDRTDPRLAKLRDLMDTYPTGLGVEVAWRLRRRKRIEDHRAEIIMKAEAGSLPPFVRAVKGGAK